MAGGFLAISYPFVKRFLPVPQMYLGVTFGWGIPMAFEAQFEQVPRVAWLLLLANVLWVTVYDTMYAMVDRDDDVKIGVRSTAIVFGDSDRHIIAVLQLMTLLCLYLVGRMIHMGWWYYGGLWAGAGVLRLSVVADTGARSRRLLSRLPQQQLFRHGGVHRHGVGISVCTLMPLALLLAHHLPHAAGCGGDTADLAPIRLSHSPPVGQLNAAATESAVDGMREVSAAVRCAAATMPRIAATAMAAWADAPLQMVPVQ